MNNFKEIKITELKGNAVQMIGYDWMLITAGDEIKNNAMTASWGGMGMLWNKPVVFIFIRPNRYTYEFVEKEEYFTCSFYNEIYRDQLNYFGTYSGRDFDKAKETGFTPIQFNKSMAFEEAGVVIECRKIYQEDINPEKFLASFIPKHYPKKDYHRMYVGEITKVWIKEE